MDTIFYFGKLAANFLTNSSAIYYIIFAVLFGLSFQLKDIKNFFQLFLALSIGLVISIGLVAFEVIHLSSYTIKSILILDIFILSLLMIIWNSAGRKSSIKFNLYIILGCLQGFGLGRYLLNLTRSSSINVYKFVGFELGSVLSYLVIALLSSLVIFLISLIFKTNQKDSNLTIGGIGIGISLCLAWIYIA